jgi:hypothetical protein
MAIGLLGAASREFIEVIEEPRKRPRVETQPLSKECVQLTDGFKVCPWGLGTLPLGVLYNAGGRPTTQDAIQVLHAALDMGIRFIGELS